MNLENVFSLIDFVEKGKISRYLLILLNALLLIMLTHYCYVWTIGDYTLSSFSSFGLVVEKFIQGKFLIPFILFVVIWLVTELIGTWVVNNFVSWVLKFAMPIKRSVLENDSFNQINWLRDLTEKLSEDKLTRNAAWNQPTQQIQLQCVRGQKFIRDALMTSVRFLIGVVVATIAIKEFSIVFSVITLVCILIAFHAARLFYLMFELIPFFVDQYQIAANKIAETKEKQ